MLTTAHASFQHLESISSKYRMDGKVCITFGRGVDNFLNPGGGGGLAVVRGEPFAHPDSNRVN